MTADNDMVERVARAIHFRGDDQGDAAWNHCQSWYREIAREQARAAIGAMREPTEAMIGAFDRCCDDNGQCLVKTGYRAMIDAALKREGE